MNTNPTEYKNLHTEELFGKRPQRIVLDGRLGELDFTTARFVRYLFTLKNGHEVSLAIHNNSLPSRDWRSEEFCVPTANVRQDELLGLSGLSGFRQLCRATEALEVGTKELSFK